MFPNSPSHPKSLKKNQNQTPNWRTKSVVGAGQPQRSVTRVSCFQRRFAPLALPFRRSRPTHPMQGILCAAPRGHAHSDDEPRPVPGAQIPGENGAGVPPAPGQLPDQRHDGVAAHRDPERRPKVARRVFALVAAAAAHFTAGRGAWACVVPFCHEFQLN